MVGLMLLALQSGVSADRLRVSPDDLRLRVAVSHELAPSLRREISDLAKSVRLPVTGGLIQTEQLMDSHFADRGWGPQKKLMVRYYFLVARMDQSQEFSDEFQRRQDLMTRGVELLSAYTGELNRLIVRAVYSDSPPPPLPRVQEFPLGEVEKREDGSLWILHHFPAPNLRLGRENLRFLRTEANNESEELEQRLEELRRAEKLFIEEGSVLGDELVRLRPAVEKFVRLPGEGLPFSL